MYSYSFFQWLLFFFIYCFLGWCCESTIVSTKQKHFVNRGFLKSPMLPIYGFGALSILICTIPVRSNSVLVYICGMIGATILELFTGWAMEKLFKVKYWDYTGKFMNVQGHICLECSLFWGFLSIVMTYVLHKPIEKFVLELPRVALYIITITILAVFVSDFITSLKTALDLAKYLSRMHEIREELDGLIYMKLYEISDDIKEKVENVKAEIEEDARIKNANRIKEWDVRIAVLEAEKEELFNKFGFFKKELLKSFPQATSKRFEGSIEELREYIRNRKSKDK